MQHFNRIMESLFHLTFLQWHKTKSMKGIKERRLKRQARRQTRENSNMIYQATPGPFLITNGKHQIIPYKLRDTINQIQRKY